MRNSPFQVANRQKCQKCQKPLWRLWHITAKTPYVYKAAAV